jgi:hypothetical protein
MDTKRTVLSVGMVIAFLPCSAVLADTASDYQSSQAYKASKNLSGQAGSAVSDAESVVPKIGAEPSESQYYDNPEKMTVDVVQDTKDSSTVASLMNDSAQAHPDETLKDVFAEIKLSQAIQENADSLVSDASVFCSDGVCQQVDDTKNKEFGTSITDISALNEEASGVKAEGDDPGKDPGSIRIFAGQSVHCRDIVLGARNCCAGSGWVSGVIHCRGEEKDLGLAKEKGGLVVYTGRYCAHHSWGVCTEHKQGYCIFPSRIAYDIQVGGRNAQLGRGFGDARNPDCSGLSADDISRIDLDKVDLSNVTDETVSKTAIPGESDSLAELEEKIRKSRESESIDD